MDYGFSGAIGVVMFWAVVIVGVILFSAYKKFYNLLYLFSVSLYIFAVIYWIDVFELGKNAILLILLFSSIILIFVGIHLSKRH